MKFPKYRASIERLAACLLIDKDGITKLAMEVHFYCKIRVFPMIRITLQIQDKVIVLCLELMF